MRMPAASPNPLNPRCRCLGWLVGLALAMTAAAPAQTRDDPAQLLEDFIFYTITANPELAAGNGQALLQLGLTDADLAELLDDQGATKVTRFETAVIRAQRIQNPELEFVATDLAHRIEQGRMDLSRDPARIDQAIKMLTGAQRQRMLGRARLVAAGEYAVPALLRELIEGKDERLKTACIEVLQLIGRQAVTPLCAALPEVGDPIVQRTLCDVLGDIGYPHAAAALRAIELDPATAVPVREAAARALGRLPQIHGRPAGVLDLSTLYTYQGLQYFAESESLIAFPDEPTNNTWKFDPFIGLVATPVPTEIFSEVMAMKMAVPALRVDSRNAEALSLFVAANLRRQNELPAGLTDPVFGDLDYTPDFYATYFGTRTCFDVLAMAIDSLNTQLVRDAIRALSQTTGGSNLFDQTGTRQPLLEALTYPDRRTQYEAALVLASALPQSSFPGDFSVVPLLASAVRTGDTAFALVVADEQEDRRTISNMLESLGFSVVGADATVEQLQLAIIEAAGIDLIVVKKRDADSTRQVVEALERTPKTSAAPTLVQAGALDLPALRNQYRGNRRVLVTRAVADQGTFESQVEGVLNDAAGGRISETEAEVYAIEALGALRDIAISGSPAYNLADAELAMLDALDVRTGGTRLLVADILAMIDTDRAQRKLWDAALTATGDEQIDLLDRLAASVKRFGPRGEPRQVEALVNLVKSSSGDTAEAVARVHGALNLPGGELILRVLPEG